MVGRTSVPSLLPGPSRRIRDNSPFDESSGAVMKPVQLRRPFLACTLAAVISTGAVFAQSAPPAAPQGAGAGQGQAPAPGGRGPGRGGFPPVQIGPPAPVPPEVA